MVVRLDPGLAFGTGAHASTGLCLRRLADLDLAGRLVIDYGCGSGILGIAALGLGAKRCIAVDIDPRALEAARKNAVRNRVAEHFDIMSVQAVADALGRADSLASDVLVANILAGPLAALAATFKDLVGYGGELMLAGVLTGQAESLIESYAPWFRLAIAASEEEWVLLAGPAHPLGIGSSHVHALSEMPDMVQRHRSTPRRGPREGEMRAMPHRVRCVFTLVVRTGRRVAAGALGAGEERSRHDCGGGLRAGTCFRFFQSSRSSRLSISS